MVWVSALNCHVVDALEWNAEHEVGIFHVEADAAEADVKPAFSLQYSCGIELFPICADDKGSDFENCAHHYCSG